MGTALPMIAMIATGVGTGVSALGTLAAGKQQEAMANAQSKALNFRAAELDMKANNELAAAQVEAQQLARQKRLALSRLQSRSAASGFTATDANSLNLASEIEQYGTLQQQMAMFGGFDRAEGIRNNAASTRYEASMVRRQGKQAAKAGRIDAFTTILGGISSIAGGMDKGKTGSPSKTSRYPITSHASKLGY